MRSSKQESVVCLANGKLWTLSSNSKTDRNSFVSVAVLPALLAHERSF